MLSRGFKRCIDSDCNLRSLINLKSRGCFGPTGALSAFILRMGLKIFLNFQGRQCFQRCVLVPGP